MDVNETIKTCFKHINKKNQFATFGIEIAFNPKNYENADLTDYQEAKRKFNLIILKKELKKVRRM